jgi:hypothetical protein
LNACRTRLDPPDDFMNRRFDRASETKPGKEEKPMRDRLISMLPGALVAALTWAVFWALLAAEVE